MPDTGCRIYLLQSSCILYPASCINLLPLLQIKTQTMANKLMDPIGRLMGLRYKSHPWHGVDIGPNAPELIIAFVEIEVLNAM